jgi:hypothetical protein
MAYLEQRAGKGHQAPGYPGMTQEKLTAPNWVQYLLTRPGIVAAFIWGLAEGSFFFIVPDLIIALAALYSPQKALRHLLAVVAGSLVAGAGLFLWSSAAHQSALAAVGSVPFIPAGMFQSVSSDITSLGVWALCKGPLSGIPYKVYAVLSPGFIPLLPFLLVSIPARLERLLVSWIIFSLAGMVLKRFLVRYPALGPALHGIYWIIIYALYWSRV